MAKVVFKQQSFRGGMNLQFDPTRIQRDQYPLLINGRTRYDIVEPVHSPLLVSDSIFPAVGAVFQGIYSAGNFSVLFISGRAYYRNEEVPGATFNAVMLEDGTTPLQMSNAVDTIYAQLVPASTLLYLRKAVVGTDAAKGVTLTPDGNAEVAGVEAAMIVQDGVSQPFAISSLGVARQLRTYAEWTLDAREYVPVGKQMLYSNGILYVVRSDGKRIYRSVTGRPFDFVVQIGTDGQKAGDAESTAFDVSFQEITCLAPLNSNIDGFFVATKQGAYNVRPDRTVTLFAEPTFTVRYLFDIGCLNQFSFADVIGDSVFVSYKGLRSFNAVLNDRNEGRNTPFSAMIFRLFKGVIQTNPAVGAFDDYVFFAVDTVYGPGVVVYDTIAQRFSAVDIYEGVGRIRQFAYVKTATKDRLLFITADNKLYEAFASAAFEKVQVYIGDFTSGETKVEHKVANIKPVFINIHEVGTISALLFSDGVKDSTQLTKDIREADPAPAYPQEVPFGVVANDAVKNFVFAFPSARLSWKSGVLLSWNFNAALSHFEVEADTAADTNSPEQQAQDYSATAQSVILTEFYPLSGPITQVVSIGGTGLLGVSGVFLNDIACEVIGQTDTVLTVIIPAASTTGSWPFRLETTYASVFTASKFDVT